MTEYMLTTIDNPFSPFTQYDDWYRYDEDAGYNTCGYLARIVGDTTALSESEYDDAANDAMDEIVKEDPFGLYIKVKEGDKPVPDR